MSRIEPEWDLAPPDAVMTDASNPRRCWNCDCYSFKVYGGEDNTQGKCFRDYGATNHYWYADGLMTCPGFKPDAEMREKALRVAYPK